MRARARGGEEGCSDVWTGDQISAEASGKGRTPVEATYEGIDDLRRLQKRIEHAVSIAQPAVVAVRHTHLKSAASGVIITAEGLVLSQWHVTHAVHDDSAGKSFRAGEKTVVVLSDGRECAAELLGASEIIDVSLLKILEPGPYPFAPLRPDVRPGLGEWILKMGHPGHYRVGRPSAVRLGRVLSRTEDGYSTDCMINGGDSGGPFFDLEGRLAGIVRGTTADLSMMIPTEPDRFPRYNQFVFSGTSNAAILTRFEAMRGGEVDDQNGNNFDIPLVKAPRLPAKDWSQGAATRAAFRSAAETSRASVVVVLNGPIPVALGTVVDREGAAAWLVTKASELPRQPTCRLPGGAVADAQVVGIDSGRSTWPC